MQYNIRQQAPGAEAAALGRLIEELAPEIAPHVRAVTALPLPQTITIRIVTVPEWMRLWEQHDERLLASEIEALSPTAKEIKQAEGFLLAKREAHRRMAVGAQTVRYDKEASVVVLADNLRVRRFTGGAWDTSFVRRLLAHELTHVGQQTAGGEGYQVLTATPFLRRRELSGRAWPFAAEGHAVWAEGLVTARMVGAGQPPSRPEDDGVPSSRWSGGQMATDLLDHVQSVGANGAVGSAQHRKTERWYADCERAVSAVIDACGLEAVNRIWTRPDLLPTVAEERDPLAWQRRLVGVPPGGRGAGDFAAGVISGAGSRTFVVTLPDRS
jgi:hypothetical protein